MFKIYDLNFKEIPLPTDQFNYGLRGLDLFLSSINRRVTTEDLPGVPGTSRTHVSDGTREVSIRALIKAMDTHDYRLKRNRVFSFFRQLGDFYVAESHEPNKLLKVSVDESYIPERPDGMRAWAEFEVPLEIVGQPYRISRYTSLDIHNNDIQFDGKWSAGMHLPAIDTTEDGILMDYQYVFTNQTSIEVFNPSDIDLYIKQHLDCKIEFECLTDMSEIRLLDGLSKEFVFTDDLVTGDVLTIEGHRIWKNGVRADVKFNEVYPTLLSNYNEVYQQYSINEMQVSAGVKVSFDFRYKYD